MITVCFVYFRGLTLAHLEAALYSLKLQTDFYSVHELFVIDNNTADSEAEIQSVLKQLDFPVKVTLRSYKHGDPTKTHSWSTNRAVSEAQTPWVFFSRADYILSFNTMQKISDVIHRKSHDWNGFVTSRGSYCADLVSCGSGWRESGPEVFGGTIYDHTRIDAGVWAARRDAFDSVGGLCEDLSAWGHAQTHFQWKLYNVGVEFVRLDDVLFYHIDHGGEKDIVLANQQLAAQGVNLQEMWARYDGPRIY